MLNLNKKKGFSLIEIIIYLAIFSIISIVVINSFIVTLSAFQVTKTNRNLQESGSTVMERISREIRQAKIVNGIAGSPSHVLSLTGDDSLGNDRTIQFKGETGSLGGVINFYEGVGGSTLTGNLLSPNIVVTNLIFNRLVTPKGDAVKIEMTLEDIKSKDHKTAKFYNTVLLRGAYR